VSPVHVAVSVAITAGCFTLSVVVGRWTWRTYLRLREALRAERERRRAHEEWLAERRRFSSPPEEYVKQQRPPFRVQ
jgi:hypothetical protein